MNPKVSLIIPVYKVEAYLPRCLESVAAQTYDNFETILVDDGSPDNCGKMCDEYAATHENVIVIHQENQGVSAARNHGMERASGEWIMFLDSDDWIAENTLETMCEKTALGYDIVACGFNYNFANVEKRGLPDHIKERAFPADKYREYLYAACILNISAWGHLFPEEMCCGPVMTFPVVKLYRTTLLRDNWIIFQTDLKNGEDKCFNLHVVSKINGVYMLSAPFYHYRQRETGSGGFDIAVMTDRFRCMYTEMREIIEELNCGEKTEKSIGLDIARVLWGMLITVAKSKNSFFRDNVKSVKAFTHDREIRCELKKVNGNDLANMKKKIITKMLQMGWVAIPAMIIKAYLKTQNEEYVLYD